METDQYQNGSAVPETNSRCSIERSHHILDAATSIFLENGFAATTTDAIQKRARVSKATLYACFPTKEQLFHAAVSRACAGLTADFSEIRASQGNPQEILTRLGTAYLHTLLSPTALNLYRVVIAAAPRFPELGQLFFRSGPRIVTEVVEHHLGQFAHAGLINADHIGIPAAASAFLSLVRNDAHLECLTHPSSRPSAAQIERWVARAVAVFLHGLAANPDA